MNPYAPRPTKVIAPRLGELLTKAMDDAGIKIRPLALMTKVDKNTIMGWRKSTGTKPVEVAKVEKVAKALGTTAESLLGVPTSQAVVGPESSAVEWLEIIERVDALVNELAELINAARATSVEQKP